MSCYIGFFYLEFNLILKVPSMNKRSKDAGIFKIFFTGGYE